MPREPASRRKEPPRPRTPPVDVLPLLMLCAIALLLALAGIWLVASP